MKTISVHGEKGEKMEKLISTDALEGGKFRSIEDWTPVEYSSWQRGWNDAIDAIISNVSTVDAPEVVRCKDCRWRNQESANCERFRKDWYVQADSFCSWGERREDGKID